MLFDFSLKSALLLIFFFHGIVFSFILAIHGFRKNHASTLWLSALSFLFCLYISPFMFGYAGWYSRQPYRDILFYFPFQQLFLIPPVLYFYTRQVLYKNNPFIRKDLLHFLPALLYLIFILIAWGYDQLIAKDYSFYADQRDKDFSLWYQLSGFLFLGFYLLLSLRLYNKYKKKTYQVVSFADSILFRWIQHFLFAFLVLLILRILFFLINPEWGNFGRKFWYYLSVSILFYYITLSGLIHALQRGVFIPALSMTTSNETNSNSESANQETEKALDINLKKRIEQVMTSEKRYQDPTLTLYDLAQDLKSNPKSVSKVVNQGFGMNFNDFVNRYRTNEVISKLETGMDGTQTLLGIALDSGFNSKSTFNRAFKKHTGMTPKEYIIRKIEK